MRRSGAPVDGILLLDKPSGMTSNRALQTVRRLLDARKAGHTGSLDPAATGMLPLCFGEATKVSPFLLDADKHYRVTARLGVATDTGDADGSVIRKLEVPRLSPPEWQALLDGFLGDSEQVPPMYSALKQGGRRLYSLAREGKVVKREPRSIRIGAIRLLEAHGARLVFRVACSKGTYVRTLVEDVAARAGTAAHTRSLHRETVGRFDPAGLLSLPTMEQRAAAGGLRDALIPPDRALTELASVTLEETDAGRFVHGMPVDVAAPPGPVRVYAPGGGFLGIGSRDGSARLCPQRLFNLREKTS